MAAALQSAAQAHIIVKLVTMRCVFIIMGAPQVHSHALTVAARLTYDAHVTSRISVLLAASLAAVTGASAQVISTVAGHALNDNLAANSTTLVNPRGVAVDQQGNILVADSGNFVIRRIEAQTGRAAIIAGGGFLEGGAFAISGRSALLDYPMSLALDASGNLYFIDSLRHRVRKLSGGQLSIVAGNGDCDETAENVAATATSFCYPDALAVDRAGNLFVAVDQIIYRIAAGTGRVTRFAGQLGASGFEGDGGPALNARFRNVEGLAADGVGNLYASDTNNNRIRRIDAETGIIRTVAGSGSYGFGGDGGPAVDAQLAAPRGLALDAAGNLIIADTDNSRVRRVDGRTGTISTIAGSNSFSNQRRDNIPATSAFIYGPVAVALDSAGHLYIVEFFNSLVRRVDATTGLISTAVGTNSVGDGGPAADAPLAEPQRMALDSAGNIYFADSRQHRVRKIDAVTRRISTIAGTGMGGFSGDGGSAAAAQLSSPEAVFIAGNGEIFIADSGNRRVRKVAAGGSITTVAGGGATIGDGGPATAAEIGYPTDVVVTATGTIYIAASDQSRVRAVSPSGTISTFAGTGVSGFSGDGGAASSAQLAQPVGLSQEASGNLLIADIGNCTIRRVTVSSGNISTVAGVGNDCDFTGDGGPAGQARIGYPSDVASDNQGGFYLASTYSAVVRRVTSAGIITTVAGTGREGFSGDGDLPTRARLNRPVGVAGDAAGNFYIVDTENARIRKVTVAQQPAPLLAVAPTSLTFASLGGAQPSPQSIEIANGFAGSMGWTVSSSTTGGNWLTVLPPSGTSTGTSPSTVTVAVNISGLTPGIYRGTITVGASGAAGSPATVPVTLEIGELITGQPGVSSQFLRFFVIQGDPAVSQTIAITAPGSGLLNWRAFVAATQGGNWLSVSPESGTAPSNLSITANPASLTPGLYLAIVSVQNAIASGQSFSLAVALTVSAPRAALRPSHSSLVFQAVQGAGTLGAQNLSIFNAGRGSMPWTIQTIMPAGGNWLAVTPASGTSDAGTAGPPARVSVNASGLAPGAYGAVLLVSSPGADNSPALVTVLLNVLQAGTPPVPVVEPAGLVFVAQGASTAQQRTIELSSTGGADLSFTISATTPDGSGWLSFGPSSGQIPASGAAVPVVISANPGQLAAGIREGKITITPASGAPVEIPVALIITPGAGPASKGNPLAFACVPSRQILVPQGRLTANFSLPASFPVVLLARVTDDCGTDLTRATVTASVADQIVPLAGLGNGIYTGTWTPANAASSLRVNLKSLAPPLPEINVAFDGAVRNGTLVPVVPANAAVNSASYAKITGNVAAPLSPGSIFSLFGSNLAAAVASATTVPLPRSLDGVQLKMGELDVPLFFVSAGQINAQVPWELAGRSSVAMAVSFRGAVSGAETVSLAPHQPGIFSMSSTGQSQGAVLDSAFRLVNSSNPVAAGETIQIFATGLGPTTPPVSTGAAAPLDSLSSVTTPVAVTIGGLAAQVDFAGLAPGFVGLYQVNARVPSGVTVGSDVPIVITQGGVASNTVTIAVR